MNPVYLDLHIHTSDNPNSLNTNYPLEVLISAIEKQAEGSDFLISLTDHNTINKEVYLEAFQKLGHRIILGVELHIQAFQGENTKAYHCHIYIKGDITEELLNKVNEKLDNLYPNKAPQKSDASIPTLEKIIDVFDDYEFLLLPHGGQTHATFDKAVPTGVNFDNTMQRSIYYNFFDGFTSRSDQKTDQTIEYLKKLGVNEFVNLITSTDNYNPAIYPNPKGEETYKFIPTWMFATPSFDGLRLSLSDSSRFIYSHEKPRKWKDSIRAVKLIKENIDIDIKLSPGLNVIIGESSSGKTLLVDSIERKTTGKSFDDSKYSNHGVEDIEIDFPENLHPYCIGQNFIAGITSNTKKINEIEIIQKIIPDNSVAIKRINHGLEDLKRCLDALFNAVERIEALDSQLKRIPSISSLIISGKVKENILNTFYQSILNNKKEDYDQEDLSFDQEYLDNLNLKLKASPFINHDENLIDKLKEELANLHRYSNLENRLIDITKGQKDQIDIKLKEAEGESQTRKQKFDELLRLLKEYRIELQAFNDSINKIIGYSIKSNSEVHKVDGISLIIENSFKLSKEIIIDELNGLLLKEKSISNLDHLEPKDLFKSNFRNNSKGVIKGGVINYGDIKNNLNEKFNSNNVTNYKIRNRDGRDFDTLSPGLKSSLILDLILNFEADDAPIIIDQPEDNLATSYINDGLVKSIKRMKNKKQIIFVSHNATIPMSGDAQNIILCQNQNGKIVIRSNPLEGIIDTTPVVDHIARIADGGKSSIKKRFKKYNLKKFK